MTHDIESLLRGARRRAVERRRRRPLRARAPSPRAWSTSPTRTSTRRSGRCWPRRPSAGWSACPTWASARRTTCSQRIAANVSPRVLEAPARLDPVRRELDEYFDGQAAHVRPGDRLVADG